MTNKKCNACSSSQAGAQALLQSCSACKNVFYCSKECQKKDWKKHKNNCAPFDVQPHDVFGRHLVATRDIKAGEVILTESPIVVGPKQRSEPICLGCHRPLEDLRLCDVCSFPMCSKDCQTSNLHKYECKILSRTRTRLNFNDLKSPHSAYEFLTPLRCLLLKKIDPSKFQKLSSLQSHYDEIKKTGFYKVNQHNVVDFIRKVLNYNPEVEDDNKIHEICGILMTNSFEVAQNGSRIRAVFPRASLLAHNCVPNTKRCFKDLNIIIRATRNIEKGEPIFANYSIPILDTFSRRKPLLVSKFFLCECERCLDPTELDTHMGTLICCKCSGDVLSSDTKNINSVWRCVQCGHQIPYKQIEAGQKMLQDELDKMAKNDLEILIMFIQRYAKTLHKNHRFNVQVKYDIVKLLGNKPGFMYKELSIEKITLKKVFAEELLLLAEKIEAGKSLLRGNLLFELQSSLAALAKFKLESMQIDEKESEDLMKEASAYLKEASEILLQESTSDHNKLKQRLDWLTQQLES